MLSEDSESRVNKRELESTALVRQAAPVAPPPSLPSTPQPPSSNAKERADLPQSNAFIDSHNLIIYGGQFSHTLGHHTNLVININQGSPEESQSNSPPSQETHNISLTQISEKDSENRTRMEVDHEKDQSQVSSRSQKTSFQKSNDIYERHLTLKGRGFPLWIPDPNQVLHLNYRRTGVRIGDVGIITHSGAFSFLFNICLPHNDPVNPRMLPEHFAPISPPIEATDIEKFIVFKNGSHLASASVKIKSQTGTAISDIVFESSASEGAILTMPRGARSEDLGNLARFREYTAANVANWYRFVNGPRGREAKNGDVRLVVGFDKTTSWGIATFANQSQQNSCLLKFGPSEGESASTYTWSEYSGIADVRAGPDSDEIDELRIDSDPPDVQFENQCLFVRTLNVTLADDVWADIHSSSGSQYPRVKNYSDSNRPNSNNPDNGSNPLPSQVVPSGTQGRLQGVKVTSDKDSHIFVSGLVESTAHPSKVLNDKLLTKIPTAKMVITHDDDWSSVSEYDPHDFVENILASRDVYQENDVVFLQPKKEISEGSTPLNHAKVPEAAVVQGSPAHHVFSLIHDKPIQESFRSCRRVNEHTVQDDLKAVMKQRFRKYRVWPNSQYPDAPDPRSTIPTTDVLVPDAVVGQDSPAHYVFPLIHDKLIQESFHSDRGVNEHTPQDDVKSAMISSPLVSPAQGTSYIDVTENRPPSTSFTDQNSPLLNRTPGNPTLYTMREDTTLTGTSASFQASGSLPSDDSPVIANNTRADTADIPMKITSLFKGKGKQRDNVGYSDMIVIVIVGPTGAGKSSFINIAADEKLKVRDSYHSSEPCTKEFAYVQCTLEDSREVVFVDTPTLQYRHELKEQIRENDINEWIKEVLGKRIKVSHILYLHDISINYSFGPVPYYDIFKKLCGRQYSASVALVLTKCETVAPSTCQERKKYLKDHWRNMMDKKDAVYSHYGTKKSAWDVIAGLGVIDHQEGPSPKYMDLSRITNSSIPTNDTASISNLQLTSGTIETPSHNPAITMKFPSFSKGEWTENVGQSDTIVIVVIGRIGAGKSSFINIAADERLKVNNASLTSCTREFAYVRCTFEDAREVVFVDTPAYPTTYDDGYGGVSQEEKVGYDISKWIKKALGKHIKASRILYLRDIRITRWINQSPPYGIFRKLCGAEYSGSVALVLTKCETVLAPATCQERTKYLTNRWKQLIGKGAAVYSHYGTKQSAWDVIAGLGVI